MDWIFYFFCNSFLTNNKTTLSACVLRDGSVSHHLLSQPPETASVMTVITGKYCCLCVLCPHTASPFTWGTKNTFLMILRSQWCNSTVTHGVSQCLSCNKPKAQCWGVAPGDCFLSLELGVASAAGLEFGVCLVGLHKNEDENEGESVSGRVSLPCPGSCFLEKHKSYEILHGLVHKEDTTHTQACSGA